MPDENKAPTVLKKYLPDELYPGVPIAGAGSEAPAPQAEESAPPKPQPTPETGKPAAHDDEPPKRAMSKANPTKAQDAYGTAALLSLLLLVVCFFFSLDFLKDIFLSHKEDYAYVPPEGFEFFGTAPLPVLLMYSLFALGLPVLIALFARFVCAKMPLDPIAKIWGIYFAYYVAVTLVSLEIQSKLLALLCGIFFIVCFYILAHDKAKEPRSFAEFAEYSSALAARAAAEIEE